MKTKNKEVTNEKNKKKLNKSNNAFPGIAVIDKYEASLKESEERFRLLSEATTEGIIIHDKGTIVEINSAITRITGFEPKDLIGKKAIDIVPKDQVKIVADKIQRPDEEPYEFNGIKKDGTTFPCEVLSRGISHQGKELRVVSIRDITKRKKAEQELIQSQENYKSLVENSPDGVFIHNEKGEVFFANPAALKIMGINSLKELNSKHIFSYVLPEYHSKIRDQRARMDKGESIEFMISKIRRADGIEIEVESKPIQINFEGKKATLVVYHDISFQRQLEKEQLRAEIAEKTNRTLQQEISERKKIEKEIKEGRNYISLLIEGSLDIICASDKEGKVTEFNKAAEQIFGYQREEVIGKEVVMLYGSPEERSRVNAVLAKHGIFLGEIENRKKTGEKFICFLSASLLKDEKGRVIGTMGVSRDITDQKETEERIKKSLKEKEVLLKEVHHRVKNNLQVISSILNLQSSYVTDKKALNLLRESQNRIKSMSFVHEILYQTKDFSSVNFSDYVSNLTNNLLQSYSSKSGIELKLDVGNVFLNLDLAIPCGLIINELVSNSLKYGFPEKQSGKIAISVKQTSDVIKIGVADDGIGIPSKIDYRKTDSLGLQLVMTLVEQIAGTIELLTESGTHFVITFRNSIKKQRI